MNRKEFEKELDLLLESIKERFKVKGDEWVEHLKSKKK